MGDPPERLLRRYGCDDGDHCCDDGCGGAGATPTVHHEDEYWGPGVRWPFSVSKPPLLSSIITHCCLLSPLLSPPCFLVKLRIEPKLTQRGTPSPQRTGTVPSWAYGPDGSRNSPWRYGGPNGNTSHGLDAIDPGGTIEEVEEGGTAPVQSAQAQTLSATAVLPVATAAAVDPHGQQLQQQPYTHYHLNDDDDGSRRRTRRHGRSRGRRRRYNGDGDVEDGGGILRLVERERRRDSERQMADADASHRREAMMMGLVDRERDRGGGGGGGAGLLDARDVLNVLLDGEAERRRRRGDTAVERGGVPPGGGGDGEGWKGALDALSRRVDEMVLLSREGPGRTADRVAAPARKKKRDSAPRVKLTKDGDESNAGTRPPRSRRGVASGEKITFSSRGGEEDRNDDGDTDTDSDETSGPSSAGGGVSVRARGRALRRAGSPSTSVD